MQKRVYYFGLLCVLLISGLVARNSMAQDGSSTEEESKKDDAASDSSGDESGTPAAPSEKNLKDRLREPEPDGAFKRSNRMEFDERLIKGQAAKSGAVYLFKRTPRNLPGLVPMRRSYRKRIVEPVLRRRVMKTDEEKKKSKEKSAPDKEKDELEVMKLSPLLPEVDEPESDDDEEEGNRKKKRRKKKKRKRRNREKTN